MTNISKWFYPIVPAASRGFINKILKSGYINEGSLSRKFTHKLNLITKRKYSTLTPNGTSAITLGLMALGVKKNDLIAVPGFSFIATVNAISILGAKPVFIDISKDSFCICEKDLEKKVRQTKFKCVVTVEVNGRSPNYTAIIKLSKKYKFKVLTDSAESLGSKNKNKSLCNFGEISCTSFSPNKIISTGQGGLIMTNSNKIFKKIQSIKFQGHHVRGDGGADKFYKKGFNFKLSDINSALGISQINLINKRLKNTEKLNNIYKKYLSKFGFFFPEIQKNGLRLWCDCIVKDKEKAIEILKKYNIGFREFWITLNKQKPYFEKKKLHNCDYVSKHGLWLASNFNIQPKKLESLLKKIK